MRRLLLVMALVLALVLAACSTGGGATGPSNLRLPCSPGNGYNPTTIPSLAADGQGHDAALMYDISGRGDKSFNDSAAAGLDQAKRDFGVTITESVPAGPNGGDRPGRLAAQVGKQDIIIALGAPWVYALTTSADRHPDQQYASVDGVIYQPDGQGALTDQPAANVVPILYQAEQSSFLVGAAAACASKTGRIGFIGGVDNQLIGTFQAGFEAGVRYIDSLMTVDVEYLSMKPDTSGYANPDKAHAVAAKMLADGVDVIYTAAGGSGTGTLDAIVARAPKVGDVWAIGVDSDQYAALAGSPAQPYILTSALKNVGLGVYQVIADTLHGKAHGERLTYNLANGGVGYAGTNPAINAYVGTLEQIRQDIVKGRIIVPSWVS